MMDDKYNLNIAFDAKKAAKLFEMNKELEEAKKGCEHTKDRLSIIINKLKKEFAEGHRSVTINTDKDHISIPQLEILGFFIPDRSRQSYQVYFDEWKAKADGKIDYSPIQKIRVAFHMAWDNDPQELCDYAEIDLGMKRTYSERRIYAYEIDAKTQEEATYLYEEISKHVESTETLRHLSINYHVSVVFDSGREGVVINTESPYEHLNPKKRKKE